MCFRVCVDMFNSFHKNKGSNFTWESFPDIMNGLCECQIHTSIIYNVKNKKLIEYYENYTMEVAHNVSKQLIEHLVENKTSFSIIDDETMNIYAKENDKVIFLNKNGYPGDIRHALDAGLIEGQIYTVDHTTVNSSSTDVYLKEYPRYRFNSVMFGDV